MLSTATRSSPPLLTSPSPTSFRPAGSPSMATGKRLSPSIDREPPIDHRPAKRTRVSLNHLVVAQQQHSSPPPLSPHKFPQPAAPAAQPYAAVAAPPIAGAANHTAPTTVVATATLQQHPHASAAPRPVQGASIIPHARLAEPVAAAAVAHAAVSGFTGWSTDASSITSALSTSSPSPSLSLSSTTTIRTQSSSAPTTDQSTALTAGAIPTSSPKPPTIAIQSPAGTPRFQLIPSQTDTTDPPSPSQHSNKRRRGTKSKSSPQQRRTPIQHPPDHVPHHRKLHAKAINNELDRLRPSGSAASSPAADATKTEGRKLRSQEATRFKSDLSAYFPDYDEVIGNRPKQQYALDYDTPIILFDSSSEPLPKAASFPMRKYKDDISTTLCQAERVDLSALEQAYQDKQVTVDPFADTYFIPVHRRAARAERSIRNTERGRAHHDRDQIARLLEDLQGHDWLRTMGVSGITESQKSKYEPARRYFIQGCRAIVEKFRQWATEERRRKAEKDRANQRLAVDADDDAEDSDDDIRSRSRATSTASKRGKAKDTTTTAKTPIKIKLKITNRAAKKQVVRRRRTSELSEHMAPDEPPKPFVPEPTPEPKEFVSFFKKRHERDATLNRTRAPGRIALAWGVPVPDMPERDFVLSERILDKDTLRARERNQRRARREAGRN